MRNSITTSNKRETVEMEWINVCLLCVLLTACVGTDAPEMQYYLLRADISVPANPLQRRSLSNIELAPVRIAPYLQQPGLVLETGRDQITNARYHQWSEPLQFSLQNFLKHTITQAYGQEILTSEEVGQLQSTKPVRLEVTIDQLHGDMNGDVKLIASWTLSGDQAGAGKGPQSQYHQFQKNLALTQDGYPAMVEAEKQLLSALARSIADTLP